MADRKRFDDKWTALNVKIKSQNGTYEEPNLPFQSDKLIKDFNPLYAKIYDKEKFIAAWSNHL